MSAELMTPGSIARRDAFGGQELENTNEVQSHALAAQAEAEVKARWAIAQRSPRNLDSVRVRLLAECQRPGFADVAKYAKPVGNDKVVGPSIRFVEAALRCMGNVICPTTVVSEDRETRRLQVSVTDLETNVSWPRQISIQKTIERRSKEGRTVVAERTGKGGQTVYVVLATEDELANKEAAAVSKAIRTAGLRLIPGDLVDEAMAKVDDVRKARTKADPAGERKKVVDAFAAVGVSPEQLGEYLGHSLDFMPPSELEELRDIHAAIKDGEAKWSAIIELRRDLTPKLAPVAVIPQGEGPGAPVASAVATPAEGQTVTESSILAAIAAAESGKELNAKVAPLMLKAPEAMRMAVLPAYQARAMALKGVK
jgi:hypothetical protein